MLKKLKKKINNIFSEQFRFLEVIILMAMTAMIGITLGGFIIKRSYGIQAGNVESSYLKEFISNYNYILSNYYGELDQEQLLDKALQTILEEIDDPYAAYMNENESTNFDIQLSGSYVGLGVEVGVLLGSEDLVITQVFDNSPAKKAGLEVGDVIIKLNETTLDGVSSLDFSKSLKNIKGNFDLTIMRDDVEKTFNLKLEEITLKSVSHELLDNNIGYIAISLFANNTYEQARLALQELENNGIQSLIIDVRSNTGGYLSSVDKILGLFLDSSHVIYQIQDKTGTKKYYSSGQKNKTYPIVVLTNSSSASASEILVAGLKENINAISVGKKTYGKGSAQKLHTLSDGTKYKFTSQKWLTPVGNSIDGVGVDVDYEVNLDESYYKNPSFETDAQLQKAISVLTDEN